MKTVLLPLCIPMPAGTLAHLKSRARLEWDYRKYVCRAHDDIRVAQRRMPVRKFDQYFKFAFVRNPWERLVSEYEYLLERPLHGRHARVKKLKSFKQFIHMQIPRGDAYQINMLSNRQGDLLTDFVGKLECLQNDWQTVCEQIAIPYQPLPHSNVTQHRHFQDYYDNESRQLVARHWCREIKLFEYSFGDG